MKQRKKIPPQDWVWYGRAAHFVGAYMCRYRLTTLVGEYIVSTVGDMRISRTGRDADEKQEKIGCDRLYETMVFKAGAACNCGCGERRIDSGREIDYAPSNSDTEARANHMRLCRKYAGIKEPRP